MSFFNTRFGARPVSVKYLNAPPPYVCRRVVSQEHNLATFDDVFILLIFWTSCARLLIIISGIFSMSGHILISVDLLADGWSRFNRILYFISCRYNSQDSGALRVHGHLQFLERFSINENAKIGNNSLWIRVLNKVNQYKMVSTITYEIFLKIITVGVQNARRILISEVIISFIIVNS